MTRKRTIIPCEQSIKNKAGRWEECGKPATAKTADGTHLCAQHNSFASGDVHAGCCHPFVCFADPPC